MNLTLLNLYYRLPSPLRTVAASIHGRRLAGWRYGKETEELIEAAWEREYWTPRQWHEHQQEQLAYVLYRAVTRVPYYRDLWFARRRRGERVSWRNLENWPLLEKEVLRQHPRAFVADDCDIRRMYHLHTSGTTGKSLDLWWTRETVRAYYAMLEARWWRWHRVSRDDRWAILGGQLITPVGRRRPPFWVWNAAQNQLYLSSYHLGPDLIPHYLAALRRYRIRHLCGYPSSLYALAQEALRLGEPLAMEAVITNAEPLFDYQREGITAAFECQVRETYGMSEIVAAASECSHGQLHTWPEVGWIEVMADEHPPGAGSASELVCTSLLNADMPLIRYRVGDRGTLPVGGRGCGCGRLLPRLAALEGRMDEILFTADGRRIGRLDPVFKAGLPIREAQIIQEAFERVRVRYVPVSDLSEGERRSLTERLQERMGPVQVILEAVDEVPRGANGKFRAVICQIPPEEVRAVAAAVTRAA